MGADPRLHILHLLKKKCFRIPGGFLLENDLRAIMVNCSFRLGGVTRCHIAADEVSGPLTKLAWLFGGAPWQIPCTRMK